MCSDTNLITLEYIKEKRKKKEEHPKEKDKPQECTTETFML